MHISRFSLISYGSLSPTYLLGKVLVQSDCRMEYGQMRLRTSPHEDSGFCPDFEELETGVGKRMASYRFCIRIDRTCVFTTMKLINEVGKEKKNTRGYTPWINMKCLLNSVRLTSWMYVCWNKFRIRFSFISMIKFIVLEWPMLDYHIYLTKLPL